MLKKSLYADGYVILDSFSYGSSHENNKQNSHLFSLLKGNRNDGLVDDSQMNWKALDPKLSNETSLLKSTYERPIRKKKINKYEQYNTNRDIKTKTILLLF